MRRLLIAAVLTTALLGNTVGSSAADKNDSTANTPPKADKKAKRIPFRGRISAVDPAAKTFTLEGKEKARTFLITTETKLKKDGQEALFDDLKVGELVGGQYCAAASGSLEAVLVNIGLKPGKEKPLEKSDMKSQP